MDQLQHTNEQHKNLISGFAIASLVLGILSFVQVLGLEKSVVAIIFGVLALSRIRRDPHVEGRKFAITGIILGVAYLIIVAVLLYQYWPQIRHMQQRQQQRQQQQQLQPPPAPQTQPQLLR